MAEALQYSTSKQYPNVTISVGDKSIMIGGGFFNPTFPDLYHLSTNYTILSIFQI